MIGLTGGIASGKSMVTKRLRELGAVVFDADEVAREVMADPSALKKVRRAFGKGVFRDDGTLDRKKLAAVVFASEEKIKKLERITHPAIAKALKQRASEAEAAGSIAFVDAALLIESGFNRVCGEVWLVTAPLKTRILRAMARDGMTRDEAMARISKQMSDEKKAGYASVVIDNSGSLEELYLKVDAEYEKVKNKAIKAETAGAYGEE
ncbi:MAG: dephospho-CoA kinase [Clostridiales bacterium]|nr:dephospho-CoA kinase [Clostridiales bacterium]